MRSPRWSFATAQVAAQLVVITFVAVALAGLGISAARSRLEDQIIEKLSNLGQVAVRQLPQARLDLIQPGGEQTRMVRRLVQKLEGIREASGAEALLVCGADLKLMLAAGQPLSIGAPCPLPPGAWQAKLAQGEAAWLDSEADDRARLTALVPVPYGGGTGVVAVRSDAASLDVLAETRTVLYVITGVDLFLAFLLSLTLAGWMSRPVRRVMAMAERIGSGEYSARVEPPQLKELNALAHTINRMAEQVERRDRELKALAATVAHEVRNPLNSIKLLISLLDEELVAAGQDGQQETIGVLHSEIGRLSQFLNDFLEWSRPLDAQRLPVDAAEPARAAARSAEATAREHGVTLTVEAPEGHQVALDQARLERCLLNLALNAIQASPSEGEVILRVEAMPDRIRYGVLDRGHGLDSEVKARLFEPFVTTRADGSGLGLSNARAVAEAHGGTLTLDDRIGGGTVATLDLPLEDL